MATKRKPTPAQIAARERFAEMARSGAFKKKAKRNPAKKTVSQKISQLTREGYPQKQAVAIALSEQRAGKVKRNPSAKDSRTEVHLGGRYYGLIGKNSGLGHYTDIVYRDPRDFEGDKVVPDFNGRYYQSMNAALRALERYKKKMILENPRASNPIILVSDKAIASKRKRNPTKPKKQRMLNISWTTAGGQRDMMSVPIDFVFTHYVGNVAERFFARTENGQLIVSEYSTGGRIGQVPYSMRAAALNDRDAAKRYVGEMLSRIGAERFKAAVKKFDPIN
jgi:hypothetical protein